MGMHVTLEEAPAVMKPEEAAKLLRLSAQRLAVMRLEGSGPSFVKAGRSVLYSRAAIESWIEKNTRRSTSDSGSVAQLAA
jgi:predicted DNA-binding transcriptional regulator AlpA